MNPSDYWRRQCKGTFQFDRFGTKLIEDMGVETLMWGSDYPHGDGVWPESSKYIEEQFGHLPAEDRKSTRLNSSHVAISYAVFCLKKKKKKNNKTYSRIEDEHIIHT